MKRQRIRKHFDKAVRCRPIALAVALAFASGQALAQVTAAAGGPGLAAALNGVPVVNIVAPNGAGVSHNKYSQFNVDSRGLILNNATQAALSQLGGAVLQNPNLVSSARLILNEVVRANRSMLDGFIEVHGLPADVVLANPAGITCNGCGFINTPRATLTTGIPNLDGAGTLTGFSIREGDISFIGNGLDATGQTAFDILARAVNVAGRINAKDLVVAGGAHEFDYAGRTVAAAAGTGVAPGIYVDSSALGGMYADRIRLVATEGGVGVRVLGDVAASVSDVTLTSAGRIELAGRLAANAGNVSIQYTGAAAADAISLGSGAIVAAHGDLTLAGGAGGATFSGGTIGADGNATFTLASLGDSGSASDIRFAGGLLTLDVAGAAAFDGPNWNGGTGLSITADTVSVGAGGAGFFSAAAGAPSGAVSIRTAGNQSLGSAAVSGTNVAVQSDTGSVALGSAGKLDATGALAVAASSFTNAGALEGGAIDVDVASMTNQATGVILGNTLSIDATGSVDNASKLEGTRGATITADTFNNSGLAVLSATAGFDGTLTADTLTNTGSARSGGVATEGITSSGGLTLDVTNPFTNAGNLVAAQDLTLNAASLANSSLIQAGGTLSLQGAGGSNSLALTNNNGATIVGGNLIVRSTSLTNSGAIQGQTGSTLSVTGNFLNNGSGVVTLADNGSLTAAGIGNLGKLQSFGSMTLTGTPTQLEQSALLNSGTIVASDDLTLNLAAPLGGIFAFTLGNFGGNGIQAGGMLTVNATGGGVIANADAGSFIRGGAVSILADSSRLNNFGVLISGGPLTASVASITNRGTGALFSQGDLSMSASGNIRNEAGGVILSNGTMSLTSTAGTFSNLMSYGSGSAGDRIGMIRSGGALSLSAAGVLSNHGWIDSNGGNVTLTASRVDNVSFAPDGTTSVPQRTLLPGTDTFVSIEDLFFNFGNFGSGSASLIFPKVSVFDIGDYVGFMYRLFSQDAAGQLQFGSPFGTFPFIFNPATGRTAEPDAGGAVVDGAPYIYRGFEAKAYSGTMYTRTPVQARIVANAGSMTVNGNVRIVGAEMRARDNLTIDGNVDLTPIALSGQSVYHVFGTDRWLCTAPACTTTLTRDSNWFDGSIPSYLDAFTYDATWRARGLNDPANALYTITPIGTGSMVTMSAILHSSGGQRTSQTSTTPGGMTINGSVTVHNPADLIPGLAQLNVASIAPVTPVVANAGPGGTATTVQPAAALIAAGVNLSLPTNPNGLFIVNPDPNAAYLIELNPLYRTLENVLFGSDYLADKLGLEPDELMQRLGDASYEAELIMQQIARQTGRSLLREAGDHNQQLQRLFDAAAWESEALGLSLGIALTPNQLNALKQDMVWMVETVVDGRHVLAPVVYLSSATRANVVGGTQIVADSLAVTGAGFINNGGTFDIAKAMSIRTTGDIVNTVGTLSAQDMTLVSSEGSVRNVSVVSRLGDSTNYRDVIDRGAIRTSGTMRIEAGQDVVSQGGDVRSGGDMTVQAGRDIRAEALILESQSVETRGQSGGGLFGTQSRSRTTTTRNQEAVGGNFTSGGDLSLQAGQDLTLQGSQARARGDVNVAAEDVNILNVTTTNTRTVEKSESGLSVSVSGNSSNAELSMGHRTSNTTATTTDVKVVAGGIQGGGDVNIRGRESATVRGSDVVAGGNLTIDTAKLKTEAAQQTTTVERSNDTTNIGMYAGGGGNSMQAGWDGNRTDADSRDTTSTARVSALRGGGNVTLNAPDGSGTIQHQGTQISAGGNVTQVAETIQFTAAENRRESTSSSTTYGGRTGVGIEHNAQQNYEDARGGGQPGMAAPAFMGTASGNYGESSGSSSSSTAVVGSITAGGNMTSVSRGTTRFEGTRIQGGGSVTLVAAKLEFNAATNTYQYSNSSMQTGGEVSLGVDATGSVTGGAKGNYGTSDASGSGTRQQAGAIVSGGNTRIVTTGDAVFQGTNMNTRGNTTISAGGEVDYQAAVDTSSSSSSSENISGGIDGSKSGKGSDSTKSGSVSGSYENSSGSSASRTERAGSIVSGGSVTVQAGAGQDLTMVGTNIAGDTVSLGAGGNVNLRAAESTSTSSASSLSAGGSLGMETKGKGGENNNDPDKGGKSGNAHMDAQNSSSYAVRQEGALITGREVTVTAGNDLSLQGTVIGAQDRAALNVGGKLDMQSAQNRYSSSSSNTGFTIGGSSGEGSGGHVGGGTGSAASESVVNRNAIVSGDRVDVNVGGDATLRGANVAGGAVNTTVGGNLSIESRTDVTRSRDSQVGGYLGGANQTWEDFSGNSIVSQRGETARTGAAAEFRNSNSTKTEVTLQSGITADRSNHVNVTGNTSLTGARIGSDAGGNVSLRTSALTQSGVEQRTEDSGSGFGFSARLGNMQAPSTNTTSESATTVLESSVGARTPMQPVVQVSQLGAILNQPSVQLSMKLNKGMKLAAEQHGGSDNVPVDSVRRILADAGVPVPAGLTERGVRTLFKTSLDSAYSQATSQLAATSIPPSQVSGILKAIIP